MNSFLELYSSSDYLIRNRDYYKSTWEFINCEVDTLIPFQWEGGSDADYVITKIDVEGNETLITGKFFDGSTLISGWTLTGAGTWTVASDVVIIAASSTIANDLITSNEFSLTAGKSVWVIIDTTKFSTVALWNVYVKKGGVTKKTQSGFGSWDGLLYYTAEATGSDYTVVIEVEGNGETVTSTIVTAWQSKTVQSGSYHWYLGDVLSATAGDFDGVFRLKIEHNGDTFYSDWLDTCGFTDKTKYKISSDYDYGGVKYVGGYAQWIYKAATVRRAPEAEFEITGDKLNGKIIKEKTVSAVRYTLKMKVTEPEWEALVHSVNGTVEITDKDGKTYAAENIELRNPVWHGTNGIVEVSFVDSNNINIWTRNNSAL